MSAKSAGSDFLHHHSLTVEARKVRLILSHDSVILHKNGIEFRSVTPLSAWAEMTVTLQSPHGGRRIHCSGVVISCSGSKHSGYHVSMVFTGISKQAQARLNSMADLQVF